MARLSADEKILELHIQCRVCSKKFNSLLTSAQKDLAITCPSCSNFALAIVEDFSLKAGKRTSSETEDPLKKKRRYRI
ncbi:MAG: hypothetical protein ACE5EZ_05775 [Thermodesulfobacteriota bacterium]